MSFNLAFKALSDPTRREILRLLVNGEQTAGELAERFDMSKPSVSHHFSVLKDADLIRSRREGQKIIYSLNTTVAQDILTWMWDLFGKPPSEKLSRHSYRITWRRSSTASPPISTPRCSGISINSATPSLPSTCFASPISR